MGLRHGVKLVANRTGRREIDLVQVEIGVVVERAVTVWPCEWLACAGVGAEGYELLTVAQDLHGAAIAVIVDPGV